MTPSLHSNRVGLPQNDRGLTLIELLIGMLLAAMVSAGAFEFYKAQHNVYLAQNDTSDRQGNVRYALNELASQVRRAGYLVPTANYARVSTLKDTLTVFVGRNLGANVDTIRYYVSRTSTPPALVKKVNGAAAQVFAEAIDTALFVPVTAPPIHDIAIALISTPQKQYSGTSLVTRRRAALTVHLRNR